MCAVPEQHCIFLRRVNTFIVVWVKESLQLGSHQFRSAVGHQFLCAHRMSAQCKKWSALHPSAYCPAFSLFARNLCCLDLTHSPASTPWRASISVKEAMHHSYHNIPLLEDFHFLRSRATLAAAIWFRSTVLHQVFRCTAGEHIREMWHLICVSAVFVLLLSCRCHLKPTYNDYPLGTHPPPNPPVPARQSDHHAGASFRERAIPWFSGFLRCTITVSGGHSLGISLGAVDGVRSYQQWVSALLSWSMGEFLRFFIRDCSDGERVHEEGAPCVWQCEHPKQDNTTKFARCRHARCRRLTQWSIFFMKLLFLTGTKFLCFNHSTTCPSKTLACIGPHGPSTRYLDIRDLTVPGPRY